MKSFDETTLQSPGWYWFTPKYPEAGGNKQFLNVDQDAIDGKWLQCRRYAGKYIGPIDVDALDKIK